MPNVCLLAHVSSFRTVESAVVPPMVEIGVAA